MNQIAGTWNAPMDSNWRDPVVGMTEWGAPIYRSALGHTYWRERKTPKMEANRQKVSELLPAYSGEYATTREAPAGYSQPSLMNGVEIVGDWALGGLTAPARALRGEPVTNGDVINSALDWGLMSAPMPAPKGAIRTGSMRKYDTPAQEVAAMLSSGRAAEVTDDLMARADPYEMHLLYAS